MSYIVQILLLFFVSKNEATACSRGSCTADQDVTSLLATKHVVKQGQRDEAEKSDISGDEAEKSATDISPDLPIYDLDESHGEDLHEERLETKKDNCLIFYHVAKCAGTSFDNWIRAERVPAFFGDGQVDNAPLPISDRNARYFSGHFGVGFKAWLVNNGMRKNCYQFAILRHPWARLDSNWFCPQVENDKTPQAFEARLTKVALANTTASACLDARCPLDYDAFIDNACRQFSGLRPTWDRFDPWYRAGLNAPHPATCDVEKAKAFLGQMDHIGIVEDLYPTFEFVARVLGIPVQERHANPTAPYPKFNKLPDTLKEKIRKTQTGDMHLYQWALQQRGISKTVSEKGLD